MKNSIKVGQPIAGELVTRQEYKLQLHRHKALNLNAAQYDELSQCNLIQQKKDKLLINGKERVRLIVGELIPELKDRCFAWLQKTMAGDKESSRVVVEIELFLRVYADPAVARALRSLLGIMLANA